MGWLYKDSGTAKGGGACNLLEGENPTANVLIRNKNKVRAVGGRGRGKKQSLQNLENASERKAESTPCRQRKVKKQK